MTISSAIYGIAGVELSPWEAEFFRDVNPFGFILFTRNCESSAQIRRLILQLHEATGRARLPILIDQEGGRVARLRPPDWPSFPPARMFAEMAKVNPEHAARACYENARRIAEELSRLGITVDCAPVADIPVPGAHDVIGDRAFGHTPEQVARLARAQAQGLMDGGVMPVLKHIPGHGRAHADSHLELPVVDTPLETLMNTDFAPFRALSDLPMAMTAHVLYTAIDHRRMATVSPRVIRLIREVIGFDGLLMTDDLSMKAMEGDFARRTRNALEAGCDVVLHCNGNRDEMRQIATAARPLEGDSLTRADAVLKSMIA